VESVASALQEVPFVPPIESLVLPLLIVALAGIVTAAAAERLGLPGWLGFLAGVVVPGLFIVAIAYLLWSGGLRTDRPDVADALRSSGVARALRDFEVMSEDALASQLGEDVSSVQAELSHLNTLGMVEPVGSRWALTGGARELLAGQDERQPE
jgi:hypothetical protein